MTMNRREFLGTAGLTLATVAGMGLVGCSPTKSGQPAVGGGGAASGEVSGKLVVWDWVGDEAGRKSAEEFMDAFRKANPKVDLQGTLFSYTDYLEKFRLAVRGGDAPEVARLALAWVPEFVDTGRFTALEPADFGLSKDSFFPGALPVVMRGDKFMTFPTNNEVMELIWNKDLLAAAGLDPEKAPATWDDLAAFAKQIHEKTGKFGFGMVARLNHGNTPYRFAPCMWAYGGSILDETDPAPKYKDVRINSEGTVKALELFRRMYADDKSVSPTAITDAQDQVTAMFLGGQVAMMIAHASDALTVSKKDDKLHMASGLIPQGPVRRAGVFGGSNIGIVKTVKNLPAAKAYIKMMMEPEWNVKLLGDNSNPGNRAGLQSKAQADRIARNPFMKAYGEMLPFGITPPQIPQLGKIWNEVIPTMLQETITTKKTSKQAADDAAKAIKALLNA